MTDAVRPEPWLRGTLTQFPAVHRALLHALQHAKEDLERCCGDLSDAEFNARPGEVAPVAFHLRHIARSVDRLLTYAEGRQLSQAQLVALKTELAPDAVPAEVFKELRDALEQAAARVCTFAADQLEIPRAVGRQSLPTTIGGLLLHVAEHTQRHVGQAITTAKIVRATRPA